MLLFVKGHPEKPTGNLLIYAYIREFNPLAEKGSIILCNVFVSFVAAEDDCYPTVVFSPTSLENEEELERLIDLTPHCDVLCLEDFEVPSGQNPETYIRSRIKKFNHVVIEYVEICRDFLKKRQYNQVPPMFRLDSGWGVPFSAAEGDKHQGLEELFCLEQIERCLRTQQTSSVSVRYQFRQLITLMESKYQQYDINNFARVAGLYTKEEPLNRSRLRLAVLYLHKFRAIYDERYEEAAKLQDRIRGLEVRV